MKKLLILIVLSLSFNCYSQRGNWQVFYNQDTFVEGELTLNADTFNSDWIYQKTYIRQEIVDVTSWTSYIPKMIYKNIAPELMDIVPTKIAGLNEDSMLCFSDPSLIPITSGQVTDALGFTPLQIVKGTATFSGTALQTSYTITHGFGFTPTSLWIQAKSTNASVNSYTGNYTSTTFDVKFNSVPFLGTNNLSIDYWGVK